MDQKQALAERIKQANNILVTVSNNPSVDQLASCIGLTLALNKLNKHATAVFSGQVPNTIEFLQPEKTIEKNTDSLRDFIIALDKAKADKLRYKVEDKVVKIFITPYKTSISEKDLEFSQGDFNVDVVLALGVHSQADLDQAITAHGRILHDAVVATVNVQPGGDLGTINWLNTQASSLSELATELIDALGKDLMDGQMATALLTGIVAETDRFSNNKTSPTTMTMSAELLTAGANQQLVATKLEPPQPAVVAPPALVEPPGEAGQGQAVGGLPSVPVVPPKPDDGTLEITHTPGEEPAKPAEKPSEALPPQPESPQSLEMPEEPQPTEPDIAKIHIDEGGMLHNMQDGTVPGLMSAMPGATTLPATQPFAPITSEPPKPSSGNIDPTKHMDSQHMILQPPTLGAAGGLPPEALGALDDEERPAGAPMPAPSATDPGVLDRFSASAPAPQPPAATPLVPLPPAPAPPAMPFASPAPLPPPQNSSFQPTLPVEESQLTASPFPPVPAPEPSFSPTSMPPVSPPPATPLPPPSPFSSAPTPVSPQTLSQIEQNVNSPHLQQPAVSSFNASMPAPSTFSSVPPTPVAPLDPPAPEPMLPPAAPSGSVLPPPPPAPAPAPPAPADGAMDVADARKAVMAAIDSQPPAPAPIQALNAQPLGQPLHDQSTVVPPMPPAPIPGAVPPGPPPMLPPQP